MRKLIISILAISFLAIAVVGTAAERNQEAYLEVKAEILKCDSNARELVDLYKKAASVTPYGWVEAWQLNNAAHVLIQMADEEKGTDGLPEKKLIKEALELLGKAKPLALVAIPRKEDGSVARKAATETIDKNIVYCERVLGLRPWN